jgi:hypothetical protein
MPSILHPTIKHGWAGFCHLPALIASLIDPRQGLGSLVKHAWKLPTSR